ncbi:hypothetical protein LEMLEM_LOCUS6994 [Lemmus lemmus]
MNSGGGSENLIYWFRFSGCFSEKIHYHDTGWQLLMSGNRAAQAEIAERTHAEWNLMRTSGITCGASLMFYE